MEKIANLKEIKKGESMYFDYRGKRAIMVRTKDDDLVAYSAICPHKGGNIEWDGSLNKLLCEGHLSLFNVNDGSIYRHSSIFDLDKGLTKIDVKVDDNKDIIAP